MLRCPLCGCAHIVLTTRPQRQGYCFGCEWRWRLDGSEELAGGQRLQLAPLGGDAAPALAER